MICRLLKPSTEYYRAPLVHGRIIDICRPCVHKIVYRHREAPADSQLTPEPSLLEAIADGR